MMKHWLTAFFALTLISGSALAQMTFVEGTDYQAISPAVKTSQPDKVVVTEIFWYGCPHCFRFEPYIERWSATLPEGVVFEQVPSSLNPRWTEHARAYYAFKMMNALDRAHKALFDAIHIKRQRLTSLDTLAKFAAEIGLDEKAFRENYFSFPVETQIRKDMQQEKRYGHRGVPSIIVNGKYLVSASDAGSNDRMIEIMNFLVARELGQ
jgi:thiol:disulfide interchange protein DsbA